MFVLIWYILYIVAQKRVTYSYCGTVCANGLQQPCKRSYMLHDEVLTVKDVATLLRVGTKTVYSMAQNGEIPAFKVRGQWRFSRKDIEAWIEQQKNTTQEFSEEGQ